MTKVRTTLDVFHLLSTAIAGAEQLFGGDARRIKISTNELKMIRDALAAEIDENKSLHEQLQKEREAHKQDKDLAAQNYNDLRSERDGLAQLLQILNKNLQQQKEKKNPFDTHSYPPMVERDDAWVRNQERIMEKDKVTLVEITTSNAWDKQVGGDHYKQYAIQPAEFALANKLDYAQANAIKYIVRHANKNGLQDLDKAVHYIELLKAHYYKA